MRTLLANSHSVSKFDALQTQLNTILSFLTAEQLAHHSEHNQLIGHVSKVTDKLNKNLNKLRDF